MARVAGVKEKLHMPLYDALYVPSDKRFADVVGSGNIIRFFVDVQGKTKLETNLQASGVLPSQNTYEARALRVVASPLPDRSGNTAGKTSDIGSASEFLEMIIYNSVTTLLVGEKIMIEMPTFWFPAGAGVFAYGNGSASHGAPDPTATFRFAEPVAIEPQQNFRVEIQFPLGLPAGSIVDPTGEPPAKGLGDLKGPVRIWVILDGYLTRDVQ